MADATAPGPPHGVAAPPARPPVPARDVLGLPVHAFDRSGFSRWLGSAAAATRAGGGAPVRVGYVNAATVDLAAASPELRAQLRAMECLVADGQSVVWAARHLGQPLPERVNITDVAPDTLREVAARGLRVALVGGRPGEAEGFAAAMRREAPDLEVVLCASGYLDAAGERALLAELEHVDPHLVLLGMGTPLQEGRALRWSEVGPARVWWCVGAVFEYFAGTRRRAPVWVRRAGLEWVVRWVQEPRRLARRYLLGNPRFIWRVARRRALP